MAERIINVTCPNCKHGIKHDTLMGTTSSIPPEEYPVLTTEGKAWCKRCQFGTFPTEDGLCTTCLGKGIETRLRPKAKSGVREEVIEVEESEEESVGVTLASRQPAVSKSQQRRLDIQNKKPKVLR